MTLGPPRNKHVQHIESVRDGSSHLVGAAAKKVGALAAKVPFVKRVGAWVTSKTTKASADDITVIGRLRDTDIVKDRLGGMKWLDKSAGYERMGDHLMPPL